MDDAVFLRIRWEDLPTSTTVKPRDGHWREAVWGQSSPSLSNTLITPRLVHEPELIRGKLPQLVMVEIAKISTLLSCHSAHRLLCPSHRAQCPAYTISCYHYVESFFRYATISACYRCEWSSRCFRRALIIGAVSFADGPTLLLRAFVEPKCRTFKRSERTVRVLHSTTCAISVSHMVGSAIMFWGRSC